MDRRRVALYGLTAQTACVATLAAMGQLAGVHVWVFYLLGFALATAGLVANSTILAMLPTIVPRELLTEANAAMGVADNAIRLAGPALAGLLVATAGIIPVFWADAASFLALMAAVTYLKVPPQPGIGRRTIRGMMGDIVEGLRFLYQLRPLFWATVWLTFDNVGAILVASVFLFYLRDVLHSTSAVAGVVMASGPVAMLALNLLAPVLARLASRSLLVVAGGVLAGAGALGLGIARDVWSLAAAYGISSAGGALLGLQYAVFRQAVTPVELLGRTGTAVLVLARLVVPLAAVVAGVMADHVGTGMVFLAAGLVSVMTRSCHGPQPRAADAGSGWR